MPSPVLLVEENPMFDRFYHRSLQSFPVRGFFGGGGLPLTQTLGSVIEAGMDGMDERKVDLMMLRHHAGLRYSIAEREPP